MGRNRGVHRSVFVGLAALSFATGCPTPEPDGTTTDVADASTGATTTAVDTDDSDTGGDTAVDSESGSDDGTTPPVACDPACVQANGSFEEPPNEDRGTGARPPYWNITAASPDAGWALSTDDPADGESSLVLTPNGDVTASQVLHLPGMALEGRTLSVSLQIKHEGMETPPAFALAALNPEAPEDPAFGVGAVGAVFGVASDVEGEWETVTATVTATGPASEVVVFLTASGTTGAAWFDDVRVEADPWESPPGPDPADVEIPELTNEIFTGFVNEGPMDFSELGAESQLDTAAASTDLFNVFFHTSWCRHAMAVAPCENDVGHARGVRLAEGAHARGMGVILTLEFTHGDPEAIGSLNPLPDGTPVGAFTDPAVQQAYRDELLWLIDEVTPQVVIIGVEMNLMATAQDDTWWDAYVALEAELYDEIKAARPETHVTTYATLDYFVDDAGQLIVDNATQWQELLPNLDSIAFSVYPGVFLDGLPVAQWPSGYFSRPAEIAPELPLFVPEFGMPADGAPGLTEVEQADALRAMLLEFDSVYTLGLIWWQLYDLPYLGAPQFFKDSFSHIGMFDWFGRPRESFVIWQSI
ncbi:MAG: hypothetical protein AAF721_04335 [Myxococcota bacterium]